MQEVVIAGFTDAVPVRFTSIIRCQPCGVR